MNKQDLINEVASEVGTKEIAKKAVNAAIRAIEGAMARKEDLTLHGFGTFKVTNSAARKGRNPHNGAQIEIPAKNVVKFVPFKNLKELVN